ncbi:DUF1194 domain-containing protein, partial [Halovulum sp. GXIMD14793]
MIRLALLCWLSMALPVQACRLALVLALDISSSVDATERALQVEGVAAALEDPEVQAALFAVPGDPVALMVFEWSGRWDQTTLVDWTVITTPSDISRLTARLRSTPRSRDNLPTALGHALIHARGQFDTAPACAQHTIDLSGDGKSNDGVRPERIYDLLDWGDITVDLPPEAPSFITRVCGSGFHIRWFRFGQARRARSPQIAQA